MVQAFLPLHNRMSNSLFDLNGHRFPAFHFCRIVLIYPGNNHFIDCFFWVFLLQKSSPLNILLIEVFIFKEYEDPLSDYSMFILNLTIHDTLVVVHRGVMTCIFFLAVDLVACDWLEAECIF